MSRILLIEYCLKFHNAHAESSITFGIRKCFGMCLFQVLVLPALESVSNATELPEDLTTAKRLVIQGKLVNFHQ